MTELSKIISLALLIVVAVLAYIIVLKLLDKKQNFKRKRLSQLLQKDKGTGDSQLGSWLEKKNLRQYFDPTMIMEASERYGKRISPQAFTSTFIIGVLLAVLAIFIYFHPFLYLLPLALFGGVIAVNVKLHGIKKEYIQLMDSKISIYLSSIATAMGTFGNIREALQSVIPSLEEPIKNDVEKAFIILQDGKDVRVAFDEMNRKYQIKELTHFHDQLDIVVKGGTNVNDTLRNLAFKMKKKATYRRKLQTTHRANLKIWKTFVFLTLSSPFLFLFVSFDNFLTIINSSLISGVFFIAFSLIFFSYKKLEQLELYDPTTDTNLQYD